MNILSWINNGLEGLAMMIGSGGSSIAIWGEPEMPECLRGIIENDSTVCEE